MHAREHARTWACTPKSSVLTNYGLTSLVSQGQINSSPCHHRRFRHDASLHARIELSVAGLHAQWCGESGAALLPALSSLFSPYTSPLFPPGCPCHGPHWHCPWEGQSGATGEKSETFSGPPETESSMSQNLWILQQVPSLSAAAGSAPAPASPGGRCQKQSAMLPPGVRNISRSGNPCCGDRACSVSADWRHESGTLSLSAPNWRASPLCPFPSYVRRTAPSSYWSAGPDYNFWPCPFVDLLSRPQSDPSAG